MGWEVEEVGGGGMTVAAARKSRLRLKNLVSLALAESVELVESVETVDGAETVLSPFRARGLRPRKSTGHSTVPGGCSEPFGNGEWYLKSKSPSRRKS
jgi:hypothetical protein